MKISRNSLTDAVGKGILNPGQDDALWALLADQSVHTPSFKPAHILYYLGGLIAIGAMSLFMTLGWEQFRGGGLLAIASAYCVVALGLTEYLLNHRHLPLPAGLTAALAVVVVPLAVYGAQHLLGYWPELTDQDNYREFHRRIDWRWMFMEAATLAAGAAVLWRYRLPFSVMPVAVTLWYISMDLTPILFGGDEAEFFSQRARLVSVVFGALMVVGAFVVDLRTRRDRDFAFWLYLFGVLTFWGGLSSLDSDSELGKAVYAAVNLLLIAIGAILSRRVFAVFGGLGFAGYLGHLAYSVFQGSMLFPLALTAIGLGVIAAGAYWQKHEAAIGHALRRWLPPALQELLEQRAA